MKFEFFEKNFIDAAQNYEITFVDIGARDGIEKDLIALNKAVHVIGFEPEPNEAELLKKTQSHKANWRSVTIIPMAVGEVSGTASLYIPPSKQGASLLPHNPEMLERFGFEGLHSYDRVMSVKTITLDDLFAKSSIKKASYIKIDVEGAELAILKSSRSILQTTLAMRIEVSFLEQRLRQPLIWEVVAFLDEIGFDVVDILDIHRWRRRAIPADPYLSRFRMPYSKGRVSQCDILAVKRCTNFLDNKQGIEAILICAALGYFDIAIEIIRNNQNIKEFWINKHGFDLEKTLESASKRYGRFAAWQHLRKHLRELIPKMRSVLLGLPYSIPTRPY